MKYYILFFIAFALIPFGCGGGQSPQPQEADSGTTTPPPPPPPPPPPIETSIIVPIDSIKTMYSWVDDPFHYNGSFAAIRPGDYSKNYNQMSYFTVQCSNVPIGKLLYFKITLTSVKNNPDTLILDYAGKRSVGTIDSSLFVENHISEFNTGINSISDIGEYAVGTIASDSTVDYYVFRLRQNGYITSNLIEDYYSISSITAYYINTRNG